MPRGSKFVLGILVVLASPSLSSITFFESPPTDAYFLAHADAHADLTDDFDDAFSVANESMGLLAMEKTDLVTELIAVQDNGAMPSL